MPYDYLGFVYATLIAAGGIMGYAKKGSVASLMAGGGSGLVAGYGAWRVTQNPRDVYVSLGTTVVLSLLMGYRFSKSGKFMPAGLVTTLSVLMAIRYYMRLSA